VTDSPLLIGVPEAARRLGIGRDATWRLVHQGQLPHLRIGRRYVIPIRALEAWVEQAVSHNGQENR
jgi:excisionase family DNA binding protein